MEELRSIRKQKQLRHLGLSHRTEPCITDLRRRKHHEHVPLRLTDIDLPDDDPQDEMLNALYSLIRRLNKLDRMYIVLWLDGQTYEEIAEIVGTNRNQVAIRLHRIKEKLKTMSNL